MALFGAFAAAIANLRAAILGQARVISAFPIIEIGGAPTPFLPQVRAVEEDTLKLAAALNDFRVPFTTSLNEVIIPSIEKTFDMEGRPRWTPLSEITQRIRGAAHPILNRTGALKAAATSPGIASIGMTEMTIGTNFGSAYYGVFHQAGTRNMPARPFLGIYPEDVEKIGLIFNEWVGTEVRVIGGFH